MAIVTKKIGKREYAYHVMREGQRVVHRYLGPADSPRVVERLRERSEASSIPAKFRTLFWDTGIDKIHIRRNAKYIIERILELGDIEAVEWLQRVYTGQTIIDVLSLSRNITEKSRNFWMLWFGAGAP